MRGRLIKCVGGFLFLVAGVGIIFVAGFRTKSPLVLNTIRRGLRATRPFALKSSGTPGAYAATIRHVGRVTGRSYETPVQVAATADGFVIALPYGRTTDWLRNVLAAGNAAIVHDGKTHQVAQPEIVPMTAAEAAFSASDQRAHRWFRIEECLVVRRLGTDDAAWRAAESA